MNLRKRARGQPCTVRLPGCDGGGETTVLAHIRYAGTGGMGMKPLDIQAVCACASCHDAIDGRRGGLDRAPESLEGVLLSALLRQLGTYAKDGVL